jgi:hypothetical protein
LMVPEFPEELCAGMGLDKCSASAIYASCKLKFLCQEVSLIAQ